MLPAPHTQRLEVEIFSATASCSAEVKVLLSNTPTSSDFTKHHGHAAAAVCDWNAKIFSYFLCFEALIVYRVHVSL